MTKTTQPERATLQRFLNVLRHMGWAINASPKIQETESGCRIILALPDGSQLAMLSLGETLPPAKEAFLRFEDLLPIHRKIIATFESQALFPRLLILMDGAGRIQLLDVSLQEVIMEASDADELETRIFPLLDLAAVGQLVQQPNRRRTTRERAADLSQWVRLWSAKLGGNSGADQPTIRTLMDWILLSRLVETLALPEGGNQFLAFLDPKKSPHPGRFLESIFRPLQEKWNLLQGGSVAAFKPLLKTLSADGSLKACLSSFALLSSLRFSAHHFAEAFADDELQQLGWKQELLEERPELLPVEQLLVEQLDVPLDRISFIGLLRLYDQAVELLRDHCRQREVRAQQGDRPGDQMDLLGDEPPVFGELDVPSVVLQRVFRVETATRSRADLARLVLLARAAEWHARLRQRSPIFPPLSIATSDAPAKAQRVRRLPAPFDPSFN